MARLRGERLPWILAREILPNALPPLIAEFGLRFCFVFLFISALELPGPRHPAAQRRLGRHGPRERAGDQFRPRGAPDPCRPRSPILTIGVNLVVDWPLARPLSLRRGTPDACSSRSTTSLIDGTGDGAVGSRIVNGVSLRAAAWRGHGPDRRVGRRQVDDRPGGPGLCRAAAAASPAARCVLDGRGPAASPRARALALRGRRVAYVAQSAAAAFNPAKTPDAQINEIAPSGTAS